jgi:hypothetical protein
MLRVDVDAGKVRSRRRRGDPLTPLVDEILAAVR